MMTKIEEMARAYCLGRRFGSRAALEPDHPAHVEWWDRMQPDGRAFEIRCMVGALKVLREPTDAMVEAGVASLEDGATYKADLARLTHRHMIDAVLEE